MRVARFLDANGNVGHGVVDEDCVLRIDEAAHGGIEDWLAEHGGSLEDVCVRALRMKRSVPLSCVRLLAPIAKPRKFLGLGANYASHVQEIEHLGLRIPDTQIWFNKQTSCIAGPFDSVVIPAQSGCVDYEGELAVVIGKRCRHVQAEHARGVIAGYVVCNDVSVRDVQLRSPTMTLGKSFDTHGPIGPWLVTAEEIPDPQCLSIRTAVNGELRQQGNTAEMRHSIAQQIAELSSVFTLEPGDILATGTPAGVGAAMQPPRFLKPGDVVRIEIERIGTIENRFVAE